MEQIRDKTEGKNNNKKIIHLLTLEDFCSVQASVFNF